VFFFSLYLTQVDSNRLAVEVEDSNRLVVEVEEDSNRLAVEVVDFRNNRHFEVRKT
jgi:hypothetical protein